MQAPSRSGLYLFDYKKTHSIALITVVNSNYQFTMVDIYDVRRQSEGRVFEVSNIGQALEEGFLNIPPPRRLYDTKLFPFLLVGDETFPLIEYLIIPYARPSSKARTYCEL